MAVRLLADATGHCLGRASWGAIHITGGEDINQLVTLGAHEGLDLATMTWHPYADLPTKRHGTTSGVVDGRWYVMGSGRAG